MDILNRVKRTGAQALAALPVVALVNTLFHGLDPAYIAAVQVFVTSGVAYLHNALEDVTGKALPGLKK